MIWTPIGVLIGFNPRLARVAQPIAQFLASFPANFLFPFVTLLLLRTHISLNWGSILLMALGTQWYILFNVIAGAISIPTDLREMTANLRHARLAALAGDDHSGDFLRLGDRGDNRRRRARGTPASWPRSSPGATPPSPPSDWGNTSRRPRKSAIGRALCWAWA